jgi:hypothetical protein
MLTDYVIIQELAWLQPTALQRVLHDLGDEAAGFLRQALDRALTTFEHVIVLMHVPPIREACVYDGRISDHDWLPHFSCAAAGKALVEVMENHPDRRATVLCGHTHGAGTTQPLPNLVIHTGAATYGKPEVQRLIHCP